jgi:hypothetical protein
MKTRTQGEENTEGTYRGEPWSTRRTGTERTFIEVVAEVRRLNK